MVEPNWPLSGQLWLVTHLTKRDDSLQADKGERGRKPGASHPQRDWSKAGLLKHPAREGTCFIWEADKRDSGKSSCNSSKAQKYLAVHIGAPVADCGLERD